MAIDTASKRFSMISFISGNLVFEPDGSVDLDDRQALLKKYNGIAFGAPPAPATGNLMVLRNKKSFLNRQGPF